MDEYLYHDANIIIECYNNQLFIESQNRLIIDNCDLKYSEFISESVFTKIKTAINEIFERIKKLITKFIDFITKRRKKKDKIDDVATDEQKTDKTVDNIQKDDPETEEVLSNVSMKKIIISDDAMKYTRFDKSIIDVNEFKILQNGLDEIANVIKDKNKLDLFNVIPNVIGNANALRVNGLPDLANTIDILNIISDPIQERRLFISIGVPYNNGVKDAIIIDDSEQSIDYIDTKDFENEKKFFDGYTDKINNELKLLKNGLKELDDMKKQINDIFSKYDTIDTAYKLFVNIASLISKLYNVKIAYLSMIDNAYLVHKHNIEIVMKVSTEK